MNDVNTSFTVAVEQLIAKTPYYPEILKEVRGQALYFTTYIRIKKDGVWYKVPLVRAYKNDKMYFDDALKSMMIEAHLIQHLHIITGDGRFEKVDELQIEESDRIREKYLPQVPHNA